MSAEVFGILGYDSKQLIETVYDLCKGIKDPEKPHTLEDLDIIKEEDISVQPLSSKLVEVQVIFTPTVPHCHLSSVIGLSLLLRLKDFLPKQCKIKVSIKKGSHLTGEEISKQIQDKERVAAAMENPHLRDMIRRCLEDS